MRTDLHSSHHTCSWRDVPGFHSKRKKKSTVKLKSISSMHIPQKRLYLDGKGAKEGRIYIPKVPEQTVCHLVPFLNWKTQQNPRLGISNTKTQKSRMIYRWIKYINEWNTTLKVIDFKYRRTLGPDKVTNENAYDVILKKKESNSHSKSLNTTGVFLTQHYIKTY